MSGLYLYGTCDNSECSYHNHTVTKCIGCGHFDITEDYSEFSCPTCGKLVDLEYFAFQKCKFSFYYCVFDNKSSSMKTAKQGIQIVEEELKFPVDFHDIKSNWTRLVIDVSNIDDLEVCPICLSFLKEGDIVELPEGKYHRHCSEDLCHAKSI
ncbi:hypothetical protein WA158_006197 [Blastocystis sp. Blastoise]